MRDEAPTDRKSCDGFDHALVDEREFGGAAADIDMQHDSILGFRQSNRARAVGCERAFKLVACGSADEFAGFLGEELVNGARIGALDGLARENDGARVNIFALDARIAVTGADEFLQISRINHAIGQERCEHDRRTPDHFATCHDKACGETLRDALQRHFGEEQM